MSVESEIFKEKFEFIAGISVYLGYLVQLIVFVPYFDFAFLMLLGIFAFSMIFLFKVMLLIPIIIIHHIIYLSSISYIVDDENIFSAIAINTFFFLPFYFVFLYFLLNFFINMDAILEKILTRKP
jgi:hypothetical protein